MDMFYSGTPVESLKQLKQEIKKEGIKQGFNLKNKTFRIAHGDPDHINNCILVVGDPVPKEGFMKLEYDQDLVDILKEFEINNYFLTYCYLFPKENRPTRNDIKEFSPWIHRMIDIIGPKLIIAINENSIFSFFRRKIILKDNHGKIIGKHGETPIIQTYPMMYYKSNSRYEDSSFKEDIRLNDWSFIKTQYNKLIRK